MKVTIKVWRQKSAKSAGGFKTYQTPELNPNMSFLEMLDVVNEDLTAKGDEPIAFDHDCREGICGTCSLVIDGKPHGPHRGVATCQTYMRSFKDGDEVVIEPFRAKAFPLVKDLVVNRKSFDRVMQAGGFISVRTGGAPDANAIPVPKETSDLAMDAAQCISCGACVAACKNASAMKERRVAAMVGQMDAEGFGACTVTGSCEAVCPKEISLDFIAKMNRDYAQALLKGGPRKVKAGGAG
jgi:succinate dehydrogenase / fumarate reductase, iron-sulfur subunit